MNARETALQILLKAEKESSYINLLLAHTLGQSTLNPLDRNFVTELVYGVTKQRLRLDFVLENFSSVKRHKISSPILNILRIGIYQLLYLDKVPPQAAIDESVKLSKRYGHAGSIRFVNGLLRTIYRQRNHLPKPDPKDPMFALSIETSHPMWLVERWVNRYGIDFAKELLWANNQVPPVTVRTNCLKTNREALLKRLTEEGMEATKGKISKNAIYLKHSGNIEQSKAFLEGHFYVQDEASMNAVETLGAKAGEKILDVCAAPGGKATYIAECMGNMGEVVAWDIHSHKIKLIEENAKRLGIDILKGQCHDAMQWVEEAQEKYDRVIVDAPCSGLGIFRKKPDMKWHKDAVQIDSLTEIQRELLDKACRYVKPGGYLLYSTCTIEPEENEKRIDCFLKTHPFYERVDISAFFPQKETAKEGYVALYPHIDETDGFFIAKLRRKDL